MLIASARRAARAAVVTGVLTAGVVLVPAAVGTSQASAEPSPSMPRYQCIYLYAPGGNVARSCGVF